MRNCVVIEFREASISQCGNVDRLRHMDVLVSGTSVAARKTIIAE